MISEMDTIIIESRSEIEELQEMIDKYKKAYPTEKDNTLINNLYNILDAMFYSW